MKRIIFTLLYSKGNFFLSRNFRLQEVGNIEWLFSNYKFQELSENIDELIILNLDKSKKIDKNFIKTVRKIIKNCFIPITIGGNINSILDATIYMESGADKILINSLLFKNPIECKKISKKYGSQCIVAGIDYIIEEKNFYILNNHGKFKVHLSKYIEKIIKIGCGEILLQSVSNDGCGYGLDLSVLKYLKNHKVPNILMGGIGNSKHILEGLKNKNVDGISTANLLNFIGDTFEKTRNLLLKNNLHIVNFQKHDYKELKNKFKNL